MLKGLKKKNKNKITQGNGGGGGGGGGGQVEVGGGGLKHFYGQPTSPWVPMKLLIQKKHKNLVYIKVNQLSQCIKAKT